MNIGLKFSGFSNKALATSSMQGYGKPLDFSPPFSCKLYVRLIVLWETTVVVSPDYVIYEDMYCSKSSLTFSCCWIKVEGSAVCGIKGPFSFEWTVGDIINIESQWCGGVETAVVNLHLKSKDTKVAESTHPSSGIVELKFAVFDPNWSERQEAIKLLNVRYKTKWNLVSEERNEDGCLGNNNIFFSKQYFSNIGESFEEVIYPKGDPDAVSISKRDIELLQPETFINDTIIDFYINYLWEEWKERKNQLPEDISSKFLNLRFVPLELPQQENSFDCGLFLLHYVELFLDCARTDFSPFKIAKFSNFLNKDWFPPAEASFKRAHIKKLICEIVEDNSEKSAPAPCNDGKYPSAELRGMDESEIGVEFLQDKCSLPEICCDNYSSAIADQEIEIIQLPATPMRGVQGSKEQDSVFREELEPRAAGELCFDGSYQSFGQMLSQYRLQNLMSPIEEVEEALEQFAYSTTKASSQSLTPEVTESLMPAKELRTLKLSSVSVVSVHLVDDEDGDSFSGGSAGESPILLEVRGNDDHPTEEFFGPNRNGEKEKFESPSISSDGLAACVVEDSEDEDDTFDSYETGKSPFRLAACVVEDSEDEDGTFDSYETGKSPFCLGKILCLSNQEANSLENTAGGGNNMLPESESLKYPAAKRPRIVPTERKRRMRSLSKDLH